MDFFAQTGLGKAARIETANEAAEEETADGTCADEPFEADRLESGASSEEKREERAARPPDRLAVLIDGDNLSSEMVNDWMPHLTEYGVMQIGRVYGNWSKPQFGPWRTFCQAYGFSERHQPDYVKGKNASDMAIAIDAMVIALTRKVDAFLIATGDSDFTPLIQTLREMGFRVYCGGTGKASPYLKQNCHKYICMRGKASTAEGSVIQEDSLDGVILKIDRPFSWSKVPDGQKVEYLHAAIGEAFARAESLMPAHERWGAKIDIDYLAKYLSKRLPGVSYKHVGSKKLLTFLRKFRNYYRFTKDEFVTIQESWFHMPPASGEHFERPVSRLEHGQITGKSAVSDDPIEEAPEEVVAPVPADPVPTYPVAIDEASAQPVLFTLPEPNPAKEHFRPKDTKELCVKEETKADAKSNEALQLDLPFDEAPPPARTTKAAKRAKKRDFADVILHRQLVALRALVEEINRPRAGTSRVPSMKTKDRLAADKPDSQPTRAPKPS